jgi:hypothetical protein
MALDQDDIRAIKELLLDPILIQIADLKIAIATNADAHAAEDSRRRDDIGAIYEKDRERTREISEVSGRVVKLEEWRASHDKQDETSGTVKRYHISQLMVGIGIIITVVLWVADKIVNLFHGGKP